jgi:hypothetical protein
MLPFSTLEINSFSTCWPALKNSPPPKPRRSQALRTSPPFLRRTYSTGNSGFLLRDFNNSLASPALPQRRSGRWGDPIIPRQARNSGAGNAWDSLALYLRGLHANGLLQEFHE